MPKGKFSTKTISSIADLSNLTINKEETGYLTSQFNETLNTVNKLNQLDTKTTKETAHVTGLKNIFREDKIDEKRMLTQNQALANAKRTHQGYFLVDAIFDEQ